MTDESKKVGPGHPPVEHQFKKGEPSRNPSGRPRKRTHHPIGERQAMVDFFRAIEKPVTVEQNGKRITEPAVRVIYDLLVARALKGDAWAIRRVVDMQMTRARQYEAGIAALIPILMEMKRYVEGGGELHPEAQRWMVEMQRRIDHAGEELFDMDDFVRSRPKRR